MSESDAVPAQESWSSAIATLAADALIDGGVISRDQFERATEIIAEEIEIRLICGDYPPPRIAPRQI
jgi:hypothetical protein